MKASTIQNISQYALQALTESFPKLFSSVYMEELTRQLQGFNISFEKVDIPAGSIQHLNCLFSHIHLKNQPSPKTTEYFYPLAPVSADTIFPSIDKQGNWDNLQKQFIDALSSIPARYKNNIEYFLPAFDSAMQVYLSNIASPKETGVSLYDEARTNAAFKVAQALFDTAEDKVDSNPYMLISGDFFGIQDFIFSDGKETNKKAAKLLRGRSFQVSLFTELAGLKILRDLGLPSISQVQNAAGKFLIIAPNTASFRTKLTTIRAEFDDWFIENTQGLAGIGIGCVSANNEDLSGDKLTALQTKRFKDLEKVKLQRLNLTQRKNIVRDVDFSMGCCELNTSFPAQTTDKLSYISDDQIMIGERLTKDSYLTIFTMPVQSSNQFRMLKTKIFDFYVGFSEKSYFRNNDINPDYIWDITIPDSLDVSIFNGYPRRDINAYVARFNESEINENGQLRDAEKYANCEFDNIKFKAGTIKPFDFLACEDRKATPNGIYQGQVALITLKGDVDNLGKIFEKGVEKASFAKIAMLSRKMNQFFSLWLPCYCQVKNAQVYTVFAGGDDFFLIGSWLKTEEIANQMHKAFQKYVANNPDIHFSAGMVMTKVGYPVSQLGEVAEEALETAKGFKDGPQDVPTKNAVNIFGISTSWLTWHKLQELQDEIERLGEEYNLSTSYLYSLIYLSEQADETQKIKQQGVKGAISNYSPFLWRSQFYYKTARYVTDKLPADIRQKALNELACSLGDNGIAKYTAQFKIPLFNYFYQQR